MLDHLQCVKGKPFNLLEIGAGEATPSLLLRDRLAHQVEVTISAIEPGDEWEAYYKGLGISLVGKYFPSELRAQYAHIHASHWLEHVASPVVVVKEIHRRLEENGTVFVEVPFADEEYWKLPLVDTPHTLFFSIRSLRHLFERNGFCAIFAERYGISVSEYAMGKWPSNKECHLQNKDGFWIRAMFRKIV